MQRMQGHNLHFSVFSYAAFWWAGFPLLLEWTIKNTMNGLMNDHCVFQLECHTLCFSNNNPHLHPSGFFMLHKFSHYTNHLPCTVSVPQLPNPYWDINQASVKLKWTALSELWIKPYFSKNSLVSYERPQTAMSVFLSSHSFRGLHSCKCKSKSRGAIN